MPCPWSSLRPGKGFFVPSLDPIKTREMGLRESVKYKLPVKAAIGIKRGLIGVWFYLRRPEPK